MGKNKQTNKKAHNMDFMHTLNLQLSWKEDIETCLEHSFPSVDNV